MIFIYHEGERSLALDSVWGKSGFDLDPKSLDIYAQKGGYQTRFWSDGKLYVNKVHVNKPK